MFNFKKLKKVFAGGYGVLALAFLVGLFGFFFAQRLVNFGSLGDEGIYFKITKFIPEYVFKAGLNDYRLKRIFSCGIVHYSLRIFSLDLSQQNIINCFGVWHIFLFVLIGHIWNLIVSELSISNKGRWLGALAIFCNYHLLKHIPFIQVNTDIFAYAITFALIYFYLKDNIFALALLSFIGSFTWPTILHMGICLMLFKRDVPESEGIVKTPFKINYLIPLVLCFFMLWNFKWLLQAYQGEQIYTMGMFSMGITKPSLQIIYLNIGVLLIYVLSVFSGLFNNGKYFTLRYWLERFSWVRLLMVVVVVLIVKLLIKNTAVSFAARPLDYLIKNLLIVSTVHPGIFVVHHILFFGPIVIFALFLWKPFCKIIHSNGAGIFLCMIIVLLFSIDPESRKQMNTYPVFIPFLIKAIDVIEWKKMYIWFFIAVSFLFSKVWLHIPGDGWVTAQTFPAQYYYMSFGAWVSHQMYYLQAAVVLAVIVFVYLMMIRNKNILKLVGNK